MVGEEVQFTAGEETICAYYTERARDAVVIIADHKSTSPKLRISQDIIAANIINSGCSTLRFDCSSDIDSNGDSSVSFDISHWCPRLQAATDWVTANKAGARIGLFGADAEAGMVLTVSLLNPSIRAVVCLAGRIDLAMLKEERVLAPTLFLVGERDSELVKIHHDGMTRLQGNIRLDLIHGVGHLLDDPDVMASVAKDIAQWFVDYLLIRAIDRDEQSVMNTICPVCGNRIPADMPGIIADPCYEGHQHSDQSPWLFRVCSSACAATACKDSQRYYAAAEENKQALQHSTE